MSNNFLSADMSFSLNTTGRFIETPRPVEYYKEMKPLIEEYAKNMVIK